MLYLEAPYYFINGVSVFRDHEDPLQHYYLPAAPRLRTIKGAGGVEVPRIQLIKYRTLTETDGGGGFLTFDVHLGLTDAEIDEIAGEIRRLARLPSLPRIAPIQPLDGAVRLMIFGKDSGPAPGPVRPGAPPPPADTRFVVKMTHFAKPALFGDNGAAFSVELDAQGATIMEAAMKGEISPIAVAYSLDYAGLRPAFSVRLKIDWDRVQTAMDETFGHESFFTSTEINNAVDKLIESQAIVMEADNFVPDADDAGKAVAERFESARMRVQEMITDGFFESSLAPMKQRPDGWDRAADVATDLVRMHSMMAATGGIGGFIGTFSYKKTNYQRIDKRKLDVEISERSAVVRTIHPQGTVDGLFRHLAAGIDPKRFIIEVDADDPFFAERKIRVINRGEMERDELASVTAELSYGGVTRSAILTATGGEESLRWLSILEDGAMKRPVEATYTVALKPDAGGERPLSARAEPRTLEGDVFEIQPAELYSRVTIPIVASPNYPWDKYPQVQVQLRYLDPANGIRTDDTVVLGGEIKTGAFTFVALDKDRRDFEYRILHRAADNKDVDSGWTPSGGDLVDIRDPFGALRLKVDVVPVIPRWDDIEQIFVDLEYEDPANGVMETGSLAFGPQDRTAKQFVVDRLDREIKQVAYRVTIIFVGGMVSELPRSQTEAPRIMVRPDMAGHRIVQIESPADFAGPRLERIDAELRYQDGANGIDIADRMTFEAPGQRRSFEFDYMDPARDGFEWRARFLFTNGMTTDRNWAPADGDRLRIEAPR